MTLSLLNLSLYRTSNPNDSVKKKKKRTNPSSTFIDSQREEDVPCEEEYGLERVDRVVKRLRISTQQEQQKQDEEVKAQEEEEEGQYINTGYTHPPMSIYFPSSSELEENNVDYSKMSELLKRVCAEREMRKRIKKSEGK